MLFDPTSSAFSLVYNESPGKNLRSADSLPALFGSVSTHEHARRRCFGRDQKWIQYARCQKARTGRTQVAFKVARKDNEGCREGSRTAIPSIHFGESRNVG